MRFGFIVLLGLVFAAGLGVAAHLIARDTVALPVSSIEAGGGLAPTQTRTRPTATKPRKRTRTRSTGPTTTNRSTPMVDDNRRGRGREGIEEAEVDSHSNASGSNSGSSGSNSGSGSSGSSSGHSGSGGGGDD